MNKIDARDVNFYYGNFHALKGIVCRSKKNLSWHL